MSTYKGNAGHLMQHWTLCELLNIADERVSGLSFIDAHAMAPLALTRTDHNVSFDRVRVGLPGRQSVYERAWDRLTPNGGYPNSAAFVNRVWTREFSMLLWRDRSRNYYCARCMAPISSGATEMQESQGIPRRLVAEVRKRAADPNHVGATGWVTNIGLVRSGQV